MNDYGIFFTKDKTVIRLPINPEVLPDSLVGNNETYNVLGIGDVTVPRKPQQRVVEIASYFPATVTYDVLTPNQFWKPEKYISFFRSAMQEGRILTYTPVRYMEDGSPFNTSDPGFKCTVESFAVEERGGETGDFYYTLTIKEYRSYAPQTVKIQTVEDKHSDTWYRDGMDVPDNLKRKKKVSTTQSREVPQDEVVVGTPVEVTGPVYQQLTTDPETPTNVSGVKGEVSRIAHVNANPYLIKNAGGQTIGWVSIQSIHPVQNLENDIQNIVKANQGKNGGGLNTAMAR